MLRAILLKFARHPKNHPKSALHNLGINVSQSGPGNGPEMTTFPSGHNREANIALATTAKLQQLRTNSREMTTFAELHEILSLYGCCRLKCLYDVSEIEFLYPLILRVTFLRTILQSMVVSVNSRHRAQLARTLRRTNNGVTANSRMRPPAKCKSALFALFSCEE